MLSLLNQKKILIAFFILALGLFLGFYLLWSTLASNIKNEATALIKDLELQGINYQGEPPQTKGFPGAPTLSIQGKFYASQQPISISNIKITSYFFPGSNLKLEALFESKTEINKATKAGRFKTLTLWRDKGEKIHINNYVLNFEEFTASGNGEFSLDNSLQVQGELSSKLYKTERLLNLLEQEGELDSNHLKIAKAIISNLEKKDKETGEIFLPVTISIKNQTLFLGPLKVLETPHLKWEPEDLPDPPQ
jgi:hypothetical protein